MAAPSASDLIGKAATQIPIDPTIGGRASSVRHGRKVSDVREGPGQLRSYVPSREDSRYKNLSVLA